MEGVVLGRGRQEAAGGGREGLDEQADDAAPGVGSEVAAGVDDAGVGYEPRWPLFSCPASVPSTTCATPTARRDSRPGATH